MNKVIRIVFDNATQEQVDQFSDLITTVLELSGIVAVQFVEEDREDEQAEKTQ